MVERIIEQNNYNIEINDGDDENPIWVKEIASKHRSGKNNFIVRGSRFKLLLSDYGIFWRLDI